MSDIVDSDLEDSDLLVDFEQTVTYIRVVDGVFIPTVMSFEAQVLRTLDDDFEQDDFEIAFSKIRYWFSNIVSRSIVFSKNDGIALAMFFDEDGSYLPANSPMFTPADPTDDHMGALFQAKMNALANGVMIFGDVKVRSNNISGLVFTVVGRAEDTLPPMSEWIGEKAFHEEPWWMRDDASTIDLVPNDESDTSMPPEYAYSLDFIEQAVRPVKKVVLRPEFKPTVIDGGKTEK